MTFYSYKNVYIMSFYRFLNYIKCQDVPRVSLPSKLRLELKA